LFLVSLSSFVIINSEKSSLKFYQIKRFTCLVFIIILVSSTITIPYSISSSFWGEAFADKDKDKKLKSKKDSHNEDNEKKSKFNKLEKFNLILDGNKYQKLSSNHSDKFEEFTISAWVTPDYSKGSSEFTIASKEKAFLLSINKDKTPKHVAKFSVFDGIKWHTIESKSKIKERLTHLVATFGDSSISLYVNGKLESKLEDIKVLKVSSKGKLKLKSLASIQSDFEINLGAYISHKKDNLKVSNKFAGIIGKINLYES